MARKWTPPVFPDSLDSEPGEYVLADPLDGFGERAFITARLTWGGEHHSFLCDAASALWGSAPWAMIPLRRAFGMRSLGKFLEASIAYQEIFPLVVEASRTAEGLPSDSGLILLRACRLLKHEADARKSADETAALRCLVTAREQDRAIYLSKRDEFLRAFPDWGA